ncbi:DUF6350 family protein [Saccharomonospora sp. CUA-673]|uniref:cell division protein PerM n=1 Tax=Saccharomonospora sp. CUA-673 TaxID=1904969 RepID=UPI0011150739|nr:DUF6350 family protein [Saccharomonospora sp. CUA-673]
MSLLDSSGRSASADGESVPGSSPSPSRSTWVRALSTAALAPLLTGFLVTAALLTAVLAIATTSHFATATVFATAGPLWLAAYQVPLDIGGQPLGVLPLVPTIAVVVGVARTARSGAQRLGLTTWDRVPVLIGVIAGAHALAGGVLALVTADEHITVDPLSAVFVPALVATLAATVGLAKPCGLTTEIARYLDPIAIRGLRAGALGIAGLLAAGGLVVTLATGLSVPTIGTLFDEVAPGVGSGVGLLLLSLVYVPNAVVLGLGFVTGPGVELGAVGVGPFTFTGGGVPPFPLLGALPAEHAPWWPVLLVLPAAVGALVGWTLRTCHDDPRTRLRIVGVAGATVGFAAVVAGFLAGGRLASGPFDPVGIPLGFVSIAAFLWIAVPGALVAWFAAPAPNPRPPPRSQPSPRPTRPTRTARSTRTRPTKTTRTRPTARKATRPSPMSTTKWTSTKKKPKTASKAKKPKKTTKTSRTRRTRTAKQKRPN